MKINTDGAWNPNSELGGLGFLIRDSSLEFVYTEAKNLVCHSAEEAEICGIRDALKLVVGRKIDQVIIEADAAEVIEKINTKNL